jgi:2-phospho-L-lactate/phosphoenolpyruvate guanylyltransferase
MRATAIVPVKRFADAKRRLGDAVAGRRRGDLLEGMLADVLAALGRAQQLERIVVVTGDRRAERVALAQAQRTATALEVLRDPVDHGHSEAATLGIVRALATRASCVTLLPGDCPLLDSSELDAALARAGEGRVAVIPDRHGTGTNGLVMAPPDAIGPAFGPGSRERHLQIAAVRGLEGAVEDVPSLALDLDTPEDLEELRALLEGDPQRAPMTAAALAAS